MASEIAPPAKPNGTGIDARPRGAVPKAKPARKPAAARSASPAQSADAGAAKAGAKGRTKIAVTPKTIAVGVAATVGIIAAGVAATVGRQRIVKASTDAADAVKAKLTRPKAATPEPTAKAAKPRRTRKRSSGSGTAG